MKMNDASCRPKEITCDGIWELYKTLEGLEKRYLWYDRLEKAQENEKLMYLDQITLGEDGMVYEAPDSMGIEFPYSKDEWIAFNLKNFENGKMKSYYVKIKVNTLREPDVTPEELMERNKLRIPQEEDISAAVFDQERSWSGQLGPMVPVNDYPVPVRKGNMEKGERAGAMARDFEDYLRRQYIPYRENKDMGVSEVTFVSMCENAPGGFVEGCIRFFDKMAKVSVHYNTIATDLCKKSAHKDDLFRLFNYMNASVFMVYRDGGNDRYDPTIYYLPRICLAEDDSGDISIDVLINYDFWKLARYETRDYFTAYCPKLLDKLAPFITGVLTGEMDADGAIAAIKRDILKEE